MTQALIIDAVRSARGRGNDKGSLRVIAPMDLLAGQLQALAQRTALDTSQLSDLIIGCVSQVAEQGTNVAKLAAIRAGWSDAVPALSINRYCASGLSAVHLAALQAMATDGLAVGGGVEMMSRVPMSSDRGPLTQDPAFQSREQMVHIGLAADAVASLEGFSREDCDAYALASQRRAASAVAGGHFASLMPVTHEGQTLLSQDETPRPQSTLEGMAAMQPAFAGLGAKQGLDEFLCRHLGLAAMQHVHHAGNSPAPADGASAVLVASPEAARRHGLHARARILACANASVDRTLALTGAVDATRRALDLAGLAPQDIDLFEVNESFAALMLHYMKHLGISHDRLNVNGGAIALGHAMGATGGSLLGMLIDELERRDKRLGVVAICGAAGLAVAMVVERC